MNKAWFMDSNMRPFLLIPAFVLLALCGLLNSDVRGLGSELGDLLFEIGGFLSLAVIPCSIIGSYLEVKRVREKFFPSLAALILHIAGLASAVWFILAWRLFFMF